MGLLITSVWTRQLQDPLHREEQETRFTLSMDQGKQNIRVSPIRVLEWEDHTRWSTQLEQNIAHNFYKAKVEHYQTLWISHKSSIGVFSYQTADCPTSYFVTTSNNAHQRKLRKPTPSKSEGRSDMHLPSLANIGVIIPMCQCACRGNMCSPRSKSLSLNIE